MAEFTDWLAAPDWDAENTLKIKSAFLMRVFFAGETDSELAMEMLKSFRQKTVEKIMKKSEPENKTRELSESVDDSARTRYWKLLDLYEDCFYRANIEWAEKASAIIKSEAGGNGY
jgi:hypothetical protein